MPHVVLILVDTLRADALGCYGGPAGASPRIDQLAAEGTRFDQAIASSGWTLPSVASVLTGTWPTLHRALGKVTRLAPISVDVPSGPEALQRAGYRTLAVANAAFLSPLLDLDRGFEEFDHRHAYNKEIRRADESVSDAIRLLDEEDPVDPGGGRPVFLLLHLFDPHLDYDPPAGFEPSLPAHLESSLPLTMQSCRQLGASDAPGREESIAAIRDAYQAEVSFVDREVGRLLDELRRRGWYDEALIVLTSDHGEELWEHGGFEHGHTLYDELVRVPLIVKPPADVGPVLSSVDAQVRTLDTLPTVFDLASLQPLPSFAGESLLPLMAGQASEDRVAFSEATLYGDDQVALRTEQYKVLVTIRRGAPSRTEVYDWRNDPSETNDLSAASPELTRKLFAELTAFRNGLLEQAKGIRDGEVRDMGPRAMLEYEKSLDALGYLRGDDD